MRGQWAQPFFSDERNAFVRKDILALTYEPAK
jgi:hypothetical protein